MKQITKENISDFNIYTYNKKGELVRANGDYIERLRETLTPKSTPINNIRLEFDFRCPRCNQINHRLFINERSSNANINNVREKCNYCRYALNIYIPRKIIYAGLPVYTKEFKKEYRACI